MVNQQVIIWILVPIVIGWFYQWYRKHLKKTRQKDIHLEIMHAKKYAHYRKKEMMLAYAYLGMVLGSGIGSLFLIPLIRRWTLASPEVMYIDARMSAVTMLPLFFLSMLLWAWPYERLQFHFFPDILTEEQKRRQRRATYRSMAIALLLLIPPAYLLYDNYTLVSTTDIIRDPLLGFRQEKYHLQDISQIDIKSGARNTDFYITITAAVPEKEIVLWGKNPTLSEEMMNTLTYFKEINIPIILQSEPTAEEYDHIASIKKTNRGRTGVEAVHRLRETMIKLKEIST